MIIWGRETKDLGFVERKHCEACRKERPFKLFLRYRYGDICYLFRWVRKKKYYLLCHVCHRGQRVDPKQVAANLKTNPIPFGTRYGWTFLVGLIAIAAAGAAISVLMKKADGYALSAPDRRAEGAALTSARATRSVGTGQVFPGVCEAST